MTRTERFEIEVQIRVMLSRLAARLDKECELDLEALLRDHEGDSCAVRHLVIQALRGELLNAKQQLPPKGLIEDTLDEWLLCKSASLVRNRR